MKKKVLKEEEYLDGIRNIIKRDFLQGAENGSNMGLNQYMDSFTSEDNNSFECIQTSEREKRRKMEKWKYTNKEIKSLTDSSLCTPKLLPAPARTTSDINYNNLTSRQEAVDDDNDDSATLGTIASTNTSGTSHAPQIRGYSFVVNEKAKKPKFHLQNASHKDTLLRKLTSKSVKSNLRQKERIKRNIRESALRSLRTSRRSTSIATKKVSKS